MLDPAAFRHRKVRTYHSSGSGRRGKLQQARSREKPREEVKQASWLAMLVASGVTLEQILFVHRRNDFAWNVYFYMPCFSAPSSKLQVDEKHSTIRMAYSCEGEDTKYIALGLKKRGNGEENLSPSQRFVCKGKRKKAAQTSFQFCSFHNVPFLRSRREKCSLVDDARFCRDFGGERNSKMHIGDRYYSTGHQFIVPYMCRLSGNNWPSSFIDVHVGRYHSG